MGGGVNGRRSIVRRREAKAEPRSDRSGLPNGGRRRKRELGREVMMGELALRHAARSGGGVPPASQAHGGHRANARWTRSVQPPARGTP